MTKMIDEIYSVDFSERRRAPTLSEIHQREINLREVEKRIWGPEGAIVYATVGADGSIGTRLPTDKEKLMTEFRDTQQYVETPDITARCVAFDKRTCKLRPEEAKELKDAIASDSRYLMFEHVEGNDIDSATVCVNTTHLKVVALSRGMVTFFSKLYNESSGPICTGFDMSESDFKEAVARQGFKYDSEYDGARTTYLDNFRPKPAPAAQPAPAVA